MSENPILSPNKKNSWETQATFNGSVVKEKDTFHLFYRAVSSPQNYAGTTLSLSTIGHAVSRDGIRFTNRQQFIKPEYEWEKFGCEDPRITKLDGKYYIFYTALSTYPFTPEGIKVGVAITSDLKKIEEKHQVTGFNSKAMALFGEKIKGKIAAILTANTDLPPAKIGIALFDEEKQLFSREYWGNWYSFVDTHTLPLQKSPQDHVEVGAAPLKTEHGWLLIYCYISNYFSPPSTFGIEAVLLAADDPRKVIGRVSQPLLIPEKKYELYGNVPNVVFPSGALLTDEKLAIYYGATDTTCCLATCQLEELIAELVAKPQDISSRERQVIKLKRFKKNPIIRPDPNHSWESKATFNPAAIYENGKIHIIYRAMGHDETSVLGYASSKDGVHLDEKLAEPIYIPRKHFEKKTQPGHSGCEDPRITKIDDRLYMCYTAYDAKNPPRVALSSILSEDFVHKCWNWEKPRLISPPRTGDKDACLLSEKIDGRYVIFHRFDPCIWIDFVDDLNFSKNKWVGGEVLVKPRIGKWDSEKVGLGTPPIKTPDGWLLIYHGLSQEDKKYRLGALLLELRNPVQVITRLDYPILEPEEDYENIGIRNGTVFACGSVIMRGQLFIYYGGADKVVCVATVNLNRILEALKKR